MARTGGLTVTSRDVHDVSLGIDADLLVIPTHAADPYGVPRLVELGLVRFGRRPNDQLLEAVLLAVFARVCTRYALGAFARDCLGQVVDS